MDNRPSSPPPNVSTWFMDSPELLIIIFRASRYLFSENSTCQIPFLLHFGSRSRRRNQSLIRLRKCSPIGTLSTLPRDAFNFLLVFPTSSKPISGGVIFKDAGVKQGSFKLVQYARKLRTFPADLSARSKPGGPWDKAAASRSA